MDASRLVWFPAVFSVVGIAFLLVVQKYPERWAARPLPISETVRVVIEPGTTFGAFSADLARRSIIDNALAFSLRARGLNLTERIRHGEYLIEPGDTANRLLRRVTKGEVVAHQVTFVEGTTVADMLAALSADSRVRFDLEGVPPDQLLEALGESPLRLPGMSRDHAPRRGEGLFFPDTYHFARGQTASGLLRRAHRKMVRELEAAWWRRDEDLPYKNAYEALILASIIEKETGLAAERPRIAGVFARRLARGMKLQSDPTVIYGLGDAFDGDLTRKHLEAENAYNTYVVHGLPPTPIALPGAASIEAALHPTRDSALYFVARGDGTSHFSDTLKAHNQAVRRYQLGGR